MAIVDKKTPRLGLLLPNADNFLQDDVERLIQSFDLLDVLVVMRDQTTGKIADDQLSAVIARLDAQGKLSTAALPSSVVQKGADGKIDASVLPSIAIIDSFPVPNEASMLGLQCERGDIAIRTDLGRSFILTDTPPSKLSNWRELTSTNVTSVNGQVGAITGLAKSGVNDDITSLTALSGPLRLGGEAAGDYDAVTLKQLRAASGGAGGASMNGVMNNFIGAVEWFQGTRAKLPPGYIAADGQLVSRTDPETVDLWQAVKGGFLVSALETQWLGGTAGRANYSLGQKIANNDHSASNNGDATTGVNFRVPDLNGMQSGSVPALFLRGSGDAQAQREIGAPGSVRLSAAPNSTGLFSLHASELPNIIAAAAGSLTPAVEHLGAYRSPSNIPESPGALSYGSINFDLSKGSTAGVYGRDETGAGIPATEVRPNSALGIWIIRASGSFTAAGTSFSVIKADAAEPQTGFIAHGGTVESNYTVAGVTRAATSVITTYRWGDPNPQMDFNTALYDAQGNYIRGNGMSFGGGMLRINNRPDGTGTDAAPSSVAFNAGNFWNAAGYSAYAPIVGGGGGIAGGGYRGFISFGALCPKNGDATHPVAVIANTWDWDLNTGVSSVPSRSALFVSESFDIQYMRNDGTETYTFTKNATSDERAKHDINDYAPEESLAKIEDLVFKSFIYNNDEQHRLRRGVIAQQAETVDPLYVKTRHYPNANGAPFEMKELDSNALLLDALAAIQVLSRRVSELEAKK